MRHHASAKIIFERLLSARKPLLVAHRKPDGDTLGAMLAVHNWLRDAGRASVAFCVDEPARAYAYFDRVEEITTDPAAFSDAEIDMVCVFDAGDLKYAGIDEFVEGMGERPFIANFDHHVTNDLFGDENLVLVGASSTAEVVHDFFRINGAELTREMSVCLMTGLLTDTSNFSNPATTVGSLEAASDLILRGASVGDITRRLMKDKPLVALKVWGLALERLKWHPEKRLATTALFRKDFEEHDVDDEHLEGLSNFLNHLLTADVVLVLKEAGGGKVKGSYRSANDIDVAEMAKQYGGGGHKKAAGFAILGEIVEKDDRWEIRLKEEKIETAHLH